MDSAVSPPSKEELITGLKRGFVVLECFVDKPKLSITQVASQAQISRTAARRHLKTLEHLGYLDSDGYFYWLTHRILRLSGAYFSSSPLSKIAPPLLYGLTERTRGNYSIGVLDEHEVVTVACSYYPSSSKRRILPSGIRNGNRLPAHTASNGKMLLASLTEETLDKWLLQYPLKRLTPQTITQPQQFREHLEQIRQQDWCSAHQEHELSFIGFAIPIRNAQGTVIAAMNVVDYASDVNIEQLKEQHHLPMLETVRELRSFL